MTNSKEPVFNDRLIRNLRGTKNTLDPSKPYAWIIERERTTRGLAEDTAVIFLTGRECPFTCLMCDLWKNTTDDPVKPGTIPLQIEWALEQMPPVKHVKLYNSGNFFDENSVSYSDYVRIAEILAEFETVIVENHPKLVTDKCLIFRNMLKPKLEIAMGLETVNPAVLKRLNKKMTTEDYRRSVAYLSANGIDTRTFILLKPPFLTEEEGIYWAERSVDFAFECGTGCCVIIPVRPGNGIMEKLMEGGHYMPPSIKSLEKVLEYGIRLGAGRVFADTWDLARFSYCEKCTDGRTERITEMNLAQKVTDPVTCDCQS